MSEGKFYIMKVEILKSILIMNSLKKIGVKFQIKLEVFMKMFIVGFIII